MSPIQNIIWIFENSSPAPPFICRLILPHAISTTQTQVALLPSYFQILRLIYYPKLGHGPRNVADLHGTLSPTSRAP